MAARTPQRQEEVINGFVEQLLDGGNGVLLSDYCNKYPLLKEALEQKYRTVRALEEAFTEEELAGTEIGEYLIIEEIGRGGMGVVYIALQQSLRRYVALKVLPFGFTLDSGSIKRFHTEAQIIARFNHPNIVPVYSTGQEKGIYYIAMALIPGLPLNKVLEGLKHFPADKLTAATVRDIIHTHPDFIRLNVGTDRTGKPDSIIFVPRFLILGPALSLLRIDPMRRNCRCTQLRAQKRRLSRRPQAIEHHAFVRRVADDR